MKDPLVELETRLAFLDDTVTALNDAVAGHERQIERLELTMAALREQLGSLASATGVDEELPPHY